MRQPLYFPSENFINLEFKIYLSGLPSIKLNVVNRTNIIILQVEHNLTANLFPSVYARFKVRYRAQPRHMSTRINLFLLLLLKQLATALIFNNLNILNSRSSPKQRSH